jgi:hypothetical protein
VLGSFGLNIKDNGDISHSFKPFMFALTLTEKEISYSSLFKSFINICRHYNRINTLYINGIVFDHCQATHNAVTNTLTPLLKDFGINRQANISSPKVYSCITHVERNFKNHVDKSTYISNFKPMFTGILQAKNICMFDILCRNAMRIWNMTGQQQLTEWFTKIYLNDNWKNFYLNCIYPGVHPDNNLLESFNRVIKRYLMKPMNMSMLCSSEWGLPGFLK